MLDASNARREDGILARSRVVRPLPTTVKNTASARMGNEQVAELSLPQSVSIEYTGTFVAASAFHWGSVGLLISAETHTRRFVLQDNHPFSFIFIAL